jgi:hypothetical protein
MWFEIVVLEHGLSLIKMLMEKADVAGIAFEELEDYSTLICKRYQGDMIKNQQNTISCLLARTTTSLPVETLNTMLICSRNDEETLNQLQLATLLSDMECSALPRNEITLGMFTRQNREKSNFYMMSRWALLHFAN